MRKFDKFLLLFLIFIFSVGLRLWNIYDVGRTYDEEAYVKTGFKFIELIKKNDFKNSFWWEVPDEPPFARYLYGLAAQFDVTGYDKIGDPVFNYNYAYSRLVSVLLSSATVVLIVMLGWRFISPTIGIYAGIIFSLLPFSLGFSQLATLESFILFFFSAGVYMYLSLLEKYSFKKVIILGVIFGLAISAKITNVLLFPLMILMYVVWWLHQKKKNSKKNFIYFFNKKLYSILFAGLIGFTVLFLTWPMPWFHLDYVYNYVHNLRFANQQSIPEIFFGKLRLVPIYYFVVLFFLTTPVVILFFLFFGFWDVKKSKKWIYYLILLWFLFPFVQSFYHMRQHGVRYIIEIYAPLSLLAAIGFDASIRFFTKNNFKKNMFFLLVASYLFIILSRITPYYYDYFNEFVGGAGGIYKSKMFQIGWWGEGTKEAVDFLEKNAPANSTVGILERQIKLSPPSEKLKIVPYSDNNTYDYVIMHFYNVLREKFDDRYLRKKYTHIHCVDADGACLVSIYKLNK